MKPQPGSTHGERLAALEVILLRVEGKLDSHIEATEKRISRLERAWAYATGAFSLLLTGIAAYLRLHE